ncbi:MAG: hypothetical protein AB1Z31_26610 [Desulfobacterales bacterium]
MSSSDDDESSATDEAGPSADSVENTLKRKHAQATGRYQSRTLLNCYVLKKIIGYFNTSSLWPGERFFDFKGFFLISCYAADAGDRKNMKKLKVVPSGKRTGAELVIEYLRDANTSQQQLQKEQFEVKCHLAREMIGAMKDLKK